MSNIMEYISSVIRKNKVMKELENYLINRVNNDPRVHKAKTALEFAKGTRNLLVMSKAQGELNRLKEIIRQELTEELSSSKISLKELREKLSEEDYKKCVFYSGVVNYLIDWMDLVVTDMNSIIGKAYPGGEVYIWDKILKLGKEAKVQLDLLYKNAESMSIEIADNSDDLFESVLGLIKGSATQEPRVGDKVAIKGSNDVYTINRIDKRRKDKYSLQKEGQIPMWVNENNINF